jgi:hypothetical protein
VGYFACLQPEQGQDTVLGLYKLVLEVADANIAVAFNSSYITRKSKSVN